jgi:hypothetical protein
VIDSPGLWTLERLGYGDIVFGVDDRTATGRRELTYRLPPDAAQGQGTWYLIRYHFRVSVSPDALPGSFAVSADTNGRTCASVVFDFRRTPEGPRLTSDSLGLVAGHEVETSSALTQEIDFRNYLQYRGVRPGRNVLTFRITANALPLVRSVRVFADTGIEVTPLGPPRVQANLEAPASTIPAGRKFTVRFRLRLAEGRPIDRAALRVEYPSDLLEFHGRADQSLAWGSRQPLTEKLEFTALKAGSARIAARGEAAGQSFESRATVTVVADGGGAGTSRWLIAAAVGGTTVALAGAIWLRRRMR